MEKTHPYKEGDMVYDLKHRETFAFSEEFDGYRARMFPELLRMATAEERFDYQQKKLVKAEQRAAVGTDRIQPQMAQMKCTMRDGPP